MATEGIEYVVTMHLWEYNQIAQKRHAGLRADREKMAPHGDGMRRAVLLCPVNHPTGVRCDVCAGAGMVEVLAGTQE